jgi:MHS family metabolite:H+ symporter-like MFS transporter
MVFAVWVRLNLKESPVFEEREDVVDGRALSREEILAQAGQLTETRTVEALQRKPIKAIAVAFFLRFGQAGNSGLIQTYLISFMTLTLAMQKSLSANVVIVSSLVGFVTIPLIGFLGDKFGRRRMYIIVMSAALVVVVPAMTAIDSRNLVWVFVGYVVLHNVAVLSPASLENVSIPEIFGARNRYTLTAVVREIAAVIATGIGPVVVAAWVAATTGSPIPIMVMLVLYSLSALIVAVWAKDWTGRDLTDPLPAM